MLSAAQPSKPSPSGRRCHEVTDEGADINTLLPFFIMSLRGTVLRSLFRKWCDLLIVHARVPWQSPERVPLVKGYLPQIRQCGCRDIMPFPIQAFGAIPPQRRYPDRPPHGQWHVVGCMDKIRLFFASRNDINWTKDFYKVPFQEMFRLRNEQHVATLNMTLLEIKI